MDASSHAVMTKRFGWKDKVAAGFTNWGSRSGDKLATLIQLALFAAQHHMHWVNLALPPANHASNGSEDELNRLGFWLGAAALARKVVRHGRPCRGHPRLCPAQCRQDVDARDKPGHDGCCGALVVRSDPGRA